MMIDFFVIPPRFFAFKDLRVIFVGISYIFFMDDLIKRKSTDYDSRKSDIYLIQFLMLFLVFRTRI